MDKQQQQNEKETAAQAGPAIGLDVRLVIIFLGVFTVSGLWGSMYLLYVGSGKGGEFIAGLTTITALVGVGLGNLGSMLNSTRKAGEAGSGGQVVAIEGKPGSTVNMGGPGGPVIPEPAPSPEAEAGEGDIWPEPDELGEPRPVTRAIQRPPAGPRAR